MSNLEEFVSMEQINRRLTAREKLRKGDGVEPLREIPVRIKPKFGVTDRCLSPEEKKLKRTFDKFRTEVKINYVIITDLFDNLNSDRVKKILKSNSITFDFFKPLENFLKLDSFTENEDVEIREAILDLRKGILEKSTVLLNFVSENNTGTIASLASHYLDLVNRELQKYTS